LRQESEQLHQARTWNGLARVGASNQLVSTRDAIFDQGDARLGDIVRYLTYHEHHGYRSEARRNYRELTDGERDWQGADLAAAQTACPNQLDFARLLPEADHHLA
jgi:hypothetical protein